MQCHDIIIIIIIIIVIIITATTITIIIITIITIVITHPHAVSMESPALTFVGTSVLLSVLNQVLSPTMSDDDRSIVRAAVQDVVGTCIKTISAW